MGWGWSRKQRRHERWHEGGSFSYLIISVRFLCVGTHWQSGRCEPCEKGHFRNGTMSDCEPCTPGTFQPERGASACHACVGNFTTTTQPISFSKAGAVTCQTCAPSFYYAPKGDIQCVQCPQGAHCSEGMLRAARGFWLPPTLSAQQQQQQQQQEPVLIGCPSQLCLSDGVCAAHRKPASSNLLCGECEEGYAEWVDTCVGLSRLLSCPFFFSFVFFLGGGDAATHSIQRSVSHPHRDEALHMAWDGEAG